LPDSAEHIRHGTRIPRSFQVKQRRRSRWNLTLRSSIACVFRSFAVAMCVKVWLAVLEIQVQPRALRQNGGSLWLLSAWSTRSNQILRRYTGTPSFLDKAHRQPLPSLCLAESSVAIKSCCRIMDRGRLIVARKHVDESLQ